MEAAEKQCSGGKGCPQTDTLPPSSGCSPSCSSSRKSYLSGGGTFPHPFLKTTLAVVHTYVDIQVSNLIQYLYRFCLYASAFSNTGGFKSIATRLHYHTISYPRKLSSCNNLSPKLLELFRPHVLPVSHAAPLLALNIARSLGPTVLLPAYSLEPDQSRRR